jgi:hypothetical protein
MQQHPMTKQQGQHGRKAKGKVKHQPKFWEFEILIQRIAIAQLGGCWNFKAKQEDHLANLDKVDGKDLFETIMTK